MDTETERRFIRRLRFMQGGCIEWTGARTGNGYGGFWRGRRQVEAHRFAYELLRQPIPHGLVIDHLCRRPACVNPAHMEVVTHQTNILRGTSPSARNAVKTECTRGHPLTPDLRKTRRRRCLTCHRDQERARRARTI